MAHLRFNAALYRLSSFSLVSLLYSRVLIRPFCISSLRFSPHDPILTGHQALAPSSPMMLPIKCRPVRMEFSWRAWAKTWHETDDLRTTNEAHSAAKLRKSPCSSSHFWIQVSCRKTKKSGLTIYTTLTRNFLWQSLPRFLMILNMPGRTNY